ncbi:MAG TPA: metallophosphoesterase family protein [Thermodesulfobacteriota bacterium]|nr:metallophosphoesterase family protein [Thermodesulfobacteriota bacterium]
MRYAILSDIHGNLESFQAVLKDLVKADTQKIIFLGDIVGYGPNPKECIDLIREETELLVAGNHDWAVAGKTEISNFNSVARQAIEWTIPNLSPDYKKFLADLPLKKEENDFLFVHASPLNPQAWNYIFSGQEALRNLQMLDHNVCFVGHSHIPSVFLLAEFDKLSFSANFTEIFLDKKLRFLINVGSIGQPRDGSPLASYGIFDTEKRTFYLRRVQYSFEITQRKIISVGLPPILAERIAKGW